MGGGERERSLTGPLTPFNNSVSSMCVCAQPVRPACMAAFATHHARAQPALRSKGSSAPSRRCPPLRAGGGREGLSDAEAALTEADVDRLIPRAPALTDADDASPSADAGYRTRKDKARAKRKQKEAAALAQPERADGATVRTRAAAAAQPPPPAPEPLSGADRFQVLEAALNTSLAMALVGVVGRQASHLANERGLLGGVIPDLYDARATQTLSRPRLVGTGEHSAGGRCSSARQASPYTHARRCLTPLLGPSEYGGETQARRGSNPTPSHVHIAHGPVHRHASVPVLRTR